MGVATAWAWTRGRGLRSHGRKVGVAGRGMNGRGHAVGVARRCVNGSGHAVGVALGWDPPWVGRPNGAPNVRGAPITSMPFPPQSGTFCPK